MEKTICVVTVMQAAVFPQVSEGRLKRTVRESMRQMINELSTAQRPAQPINTAQMRGGRGGCLPPGRPRGQI